MKKHSLASVALIIACSPFAQARIGTIISNTPNTSVTVASDEVIQIIGSAHSLNGTTTNNLPGFVRFAVSGFSGSFDVGSCFRAQGDIGSYVGQTFVGPLTLSVWSQANGRSMITYRILPTSAYAQATLDKLTVPQNSGMAKN